LSASANARDGDLDTTFNGTGLQILEGPTDELDIQIVGGCIDADDVVLVAAFVYDPLGGEEARDFLVARWREDGTPDTDFSFDGQMQVGFENGYPQGCAMAPDGRIVVFGNAMDATHPETFIDIAIARIDSDGTLDNSFDGDGRTMVDFSLGGTFDGGSDALVRADGRIVAVGEAQTSVGAKAAVTRLTLDGQRDDSFDLDGRVSFGFDAGNPTEFASAAAVAEDGQSRLLIAASTDTRGSGDFAIIRLLENGSLDASFGDGGKAIVPFDLAGNLHDTATSVLVQPDGRIVGAGFACSGGDETSCHTRDIAIMRLDESGDLDPTFGFGGRRAFPLDIGGTLDDVAFQVLHQHDGRLILTGFLDAGASLGYEFFALRLLADGRPDPDFGTGGLVVHGYNAGEATSDFGFRARLDSRERIVITGQLSMSDGRSRGMLMRLANGDSLFGDGFDPI
jgi:uncharacterized delta-60 repeat protein